MLETATLVPRLTLFFIVQFASTVIHKSGTVAEIQGSVNHMRISRGPNGDECSGWGLMGSVFNRRLSLSFTTLPYLCSWKSG